MMESENKPVLSQKEYLKRYLSKDKHKKKKKNPTISSSSHIKRSVIIDDDLGLKDVADIDDEEFNLDYLGDEAPQIAGIVDERPTEVRAKEKYDSNLWRTVGETYKDGDCLQDSVKHSELTKIKDNLDSDSDLSEINKIEMARKQDRNKYNYDSDLSPERNLDRKKRDRKENSSESDLSPERNRNSKRKERKKHSSDSEWSPARNSSKNKKDRKKYNNDSDFSPERNNDRNNIGRKKLNDSDLSPERNRDKKKKEYNSDSDMSPPRPSKIKKKSSYRNDDVNVLRNKDVSREKRNFISSKINHNFDHHYKARKKTYIDEESDTDMSQTKKLKYGSREKYKEREKEYRSNLEKSSVPSVSNQDNDSSRHRDREKRKTERSSTYSGTKLHDNLDIPEKSYKSSRISRNDDRKGSISDLSPARNLSQSGKKKDKSNCRAEEKMQDGKKSGLQDAKHLKEELKRLKANEDKMFRKMDPSVLGAMAAPIQRDRKTGMVKQIAKEKEEERIKTEKRAQTENKYYKWGKGLKQMEEQEDRIADAIHEMSKPLARYRDDKDLDAYLRAQEREGDPMLDYIKNKQAESHNVIDLTVGSSKPMYNGSYMPNRFGIRPGYRWDGVDRSNGYEKRWFEQKNARKAVEEAAYKWSTSDM